MRWALLAPGPSANSAVAERLEGLPLGVVGCAFQLAPWADFIASSDRAWWTRYPEAYELSSKRFAMGASVHGVEIVQIQSLGQVVNSGVLALECAVHMGATEILLAGFDMHGSHFFGPYTNGLRNADENKRRQHLKQYEQWAGMNRKVRVLNCTPGSKITCFPMSSLNACLPELAA